jgi:hypothetical protein
MGNNRKQTKGRKFKHKPVKRKVRTSVGDIYVDDPKVTEKVVQAPSLKIKK